MTRQEMIAHAYAEDIPRGDITTDSIGLKSRTGDAKVVAKEDLVMAGRNMFEDCIRHVIPEMQLKWQFKDGDFILKGQTVCWLKGDLALLLRAERVALNYLGRLSGIASLTRCFVQEITGTKCQILDTRKTTPLWRELEKAAVRAGGGTNHRMDLSSAIMVKENHMRAAGGMKEALRAIRSKTSEAIEVECSTIEEVSMAVNERVQRIMLDNMSTAEMRQARTLIPATIQVEASGNMNLARVREVAETGVDFISVGALTHSAPCADYSMLFEWREPEDKK